MADIKADNESLVFALRTLGFYMERDRLVLEAMSPKDQNVRLKKAFDRAVENVCIMSLLYDVKESRAGKLKLSNRRKWSGWQENRNALYIQTIRDTPGDQFRRGLTTLAKCLGKHSIWASIRMGHYSVERSVEIQGASVRRAIDVPELETFLSRCILQPALNIDTAGSSYTGSWWAITRIPACDHSDTLNEPWPNQTQAVIAIRPLDVIELELPAPIDTAANEPDEQDMAQAGYVGNENRKAVPVVVVRYATSSSGFGTSADVQALITHSGMDRIPPQVGYITPLQLSLFTRLLESNSRRLSPSDRKKYQADVPRRIQERTSISFFSPIYCPSPDIADQIEIGRRPRLSCAVCKTEQGPDVKLFFCTGCAGIAYCSSEHQQQDWQSSHKADCRLLKRDQQYKQPSWTRINPADDSSPIASVLMPITPVDPDACLGESFEISKNPVDRLKPASRSLQRSQIQKTIYDPGERFLVRVRWGGHAEQVFGVNEQARRDGSYNASNTSDAHRFFMNTIHIIDRPCSVTCFLQRQTGQFGNFLVVGTCGEMREEDNSVIFDAMVNIIKTSTRDKAEVYYFWAMRRGDCLEIDLQDLPHQSLGW